MPDYNLEPDASIVPIHINDDISSLSAILLDDAYYQFMMDGRTIINGIPVLRAEYLIPFKMYAWLDLTDRKLRNEHVNERDLKKHKYDVFRLLQLVTLPQVIECGDTVKNNIRRFLELMQGEELPLAQLQLPFEKEPALNILGEVYQI